MLLFLFFIIVTFISIPSLIFWRKIKHMLSIARPVLKLAYQLNILFKFKRNQMYQSLSLKKFVISLKINNGFSVSLNISITIKQIHGHGS